MTHETRPAGLEFDVAIRHFLAGFRLPGEAQKIDRIMETFAARYCALNAEVFPSADVAFALAFSVIMLQTDLHNPAIKEEKKMTKDGFRRNNRGICNGSDLDAQFLDEIFDRIKAAPITLKEDEQLKERLEKLKQDGDHATHDLEEEHRRRLELERENESLKRELANAKAATANSQPSWRPHHRHCRWGCSIWPSTVIPKWQLRGATQTGCRRLLA